MAKRKNPSQLNIPMCAAGVLLCLTLFSVHLTSGLYAKYTATATGSDSARVAKFEVVYAKDPDDIVITSDGVNNDNIYAFTITNNSEVAVSYQLSLQDEPPNGVTYQFSPQNGDLDPVGGANTADNSTLTFTPSWAEFTAELTNENPTKNFEFTIVVHIEQID